MDPLSGWRAHRGLGSAEIHCFADSGEGWVKEDSVVARAYGGGNQNICSWDPGLLCPRWKTGAAAAREKEIDSVESARGKILGETEEKERIDHEDLQEIFDPKSPGWIFKNPSLPWLSIKSGCLRGHTCNISPVRPISLGP